MKLKFNAKIKILGVNPYILITKDQAQKLQPNWKKPLPVLVQINGKPKKPWRINMMPVGDGSFYLYLAGAVRKTSQTQVGDLVKVNLQFDSNYKSGPQHPIPAGLKKALKQNVKIQKKWDQLPPSRKKEILRYFANLKSTEALDRNLQKIVIALSGGPIQFMGRTWKEGK